MAEYTVAANAVGKHEIALAADTESIVTFTRDCQAVEVSVLASTDPVYFTLDDTPVELPPADEADDCHFAFAGPNSVRISIDRANPLGENPDLAAITKVRLKSAGAATVTVERA